MRLKYGDQTFRGAFEMLVDDQVQVTLETPGGPRRLYYLRVEEVLMEIEPDGAGTPALRPRAPGGDRRSEGRLTHHEGQATGHGRVLGP